MSGSPALAPSVEVSALLRQVEHQGGFGAVLHKGDPDRGTLFLLVSERGHPRAQVRRALTAFGDYRWEARWNDAESDESALSESVRRARARDPDLWVVELDVPSAERFVAELIG